MILPADLDSLELPVFLLEVGIEIFCGTIFLFKNLSDFIQFPAWLLTRDRPDRGEIVKVMKIGILVSKFPAVSVAFQTSGTAFSIVITFLEKRIV